MNGVPGQEQTADELNSAAGRGDCLAAGTLVAGEIGPVAVEKLAVGDRVFCCDSETGCLALKAVVRKTIRLEGKVWKIRVGGEEIEACGGHLFWVAGKGWVKARELREGMPLHTIRGTVAVESVEEGEQQTAFSVATADFHTFFVGKDAILTHDNTIHPPTERLVPGLATEKETKAAQKGKKAS
jgi:intein/homing endonuclease